MAAPYRGNTGFSTYFITAATFQKHSLFQSEGMALSGFTPTKRTYWAAIMPWVLWNVKP